jgi:hypothetical protein
MPGVPGCAPGSERAGVVHLSCRWDCSRWSGGCWHDAEPLPAGQEGPAPGPVGADGEGSLAGVAGESRGKVPDLVAERVRGGVPQARVVAVAEEAGLGGEVGGDVRRGDPAGVDPPRFR